MVTGEWAMADIMGITDHIMARVGTIQMKSWTQVLPIRLMIAQEEEIALTTNPCINQILAGRVG